jgi:hypothetical protein
MLESAAWCYSVYLGKGCPELVWYPGNFPIICYGLMSTYLDIPSEVRGRTYYWAGEVAAEAEESWCCSVAISQDSSLTKRLLSYRSLTTNVFH